MEAEEGGEGAEGVIEGMLDNGLRDGEVYDI